MISRVLTILLILFQCYALKGQDQLIIDSLSNVIEKSQADTNNVKALNQLAGEFLRSNPDTALGLAEKAMGLSISLEYIPGEIMASYNIGYVYYVQSNYDEALINWQKTLELRKQQGDLLSVAASFNNIASIYKKRAEYPMALSYLFKAVKIYEELGERTVGAGNSHILIGNIYLNQSNFPKALEQYYQSLKIFEELDNKQGMAYCYGNMAIVYHSQKEYDKALEYYIDDLKIQEEVGNKLGAAVANGNVGGLYYELLNYPEAINYYFKAIKMYEELGNKEGASSTYNNIATLYTEVHQEQDQDLIKEISNWASENPASLLDTALYYQYKALKINEELSDEYNMTYSIGGIADIYYDKGDLSQAMKYYKRNISISDSIGAVERSKDSHIGLSLCYEELGAYELALAHYKQHTILKDSLFNEEKSKDLGKLEAKYEFERAEEEQKRIELNELKMANEQKQRRDNLQYSGILIFIVLVFAVVFALGKISIPIRLAEGLIFFSFLLFFEFTLVLLDPYIEQYSSGAPAIKLGFNAVLAGLIFPLHSFFESKMKKRLVKS